MLFTWLFPVDKYFNRQNESFNTSGHEYLHNNRYLTRRDTKSVKTDVYRSFEGFLGDKASYNKRCDFVSEKRCLRFYEILVQ